METGEKVIIALVVVVTLGVLVGAIVGLKFGMPIMEEEMHKPESCGKNCHEMQPFYDSLMISPHAEVDCHECHKPHKPEMFLYIGEALHHVEGMVEGKDEGKSLDETFDEMAKHIENKPPASPKVEYCMECHSEHAVPSEKVSDASISCFKCHSTIEHTTHRISEYFRGYEPDYSGMGYESPDYTGYECVACHNDHDINVKEETCNICHPPEKHL
jgi:cytochrome c nitrite reductase small subunit